MVKMPVIDILVCDFGMIGQAYCKVGLMCKSKCLQNSTALQTIPTKILNHFYSPPDRYFTKFGIYKIYTHCIRTTTYIGTATKQCNWFHV